MNSQSGKGGVAFLLEAHYGVTLPRRLQVHFSPVVQRAAEARGGELSAAALWQLFCDEYQHRDQPYAYQDHSLREQGGRSAITLVLGHGSRTITVEGRGNGPLGAACQALSRLEGLHGLRIDDHAEHALGRGADAQAWALVEVACPGVAGSHFGVGTQDCAVSASLRALVAGINQLMCAAPRRLTAAAEWV